MQRLSFYTISCLMISFSCACADTENEQPPAGTLPDSRTLNTSRPADPATTGILPYEVDRPDMMDMSTDMPVDMPDDMPVDMPIDDGDICSRVTECMPNQDSCLGQQLRSCKTDENGCFVWDTAQDCPNGSICQDNICTLINNCLDSDGDGYGMGCARGNDCDDTDQNRHPGKMEVCDGVDNNCNNLIDEGISGVGDTCSAGQGACRVNGTRVCDSNNAVTCNATAGQPAAMDTCGDGIDDDCNGVIDDNCPLPPCANDGQEPNNVLAQAFDMTLNSPYVGFICAQDKDFYKLNVVTGETYRLNLAFPDAPSDLDLILYENNVEVFASDSATDHEGIQFVAQAGITYHAEVRNIAGQSNRYRISLVDSWACYEEDSFEKDDNINYLNRLPAGWRAPAYICSNNRDVFYLGDVSVGERISVDAYFSVGFFGGGDLDLILYGDDDGDGTFDFIKRADSGGDDEFLVHTSAYTGRYAVIVEGYGGEENDYEIKWSKQ